MDPFSIAVFLFVGIVLLVILVGTVGICVKCLAARKRRKLAPSEDGGEAARTQCWVTESPYPTSEMSKLSPRPEQQQKQFFEEQCHQQFTATPIDQFMEPITGVLILRPAVPPIQQQSRSEPPAVVPVPAQHHQHQTQPQPQHFQAPFVPQQTTISSSGGDSVVVVDPQQMDGPNGSRGSGSAGSDSKNSFALSEQRQQIGEQTPKQPNAIALLHKANEFESVVLLAGTPNDESAANEQRPPEAEEHQKVEGTGGTIEREEPLENEEADEEEEEMGTDERLKKQQSIVEALEKENCGAELLTKSAKIERAMLGMGKNLPEDRMAEQQEREAIQKAIGPPEPHLD